ncbi:hypothetical protein MUN78_13940 [Leucobacter allii]|uniref:Uncharacterized protein n=1 Tax=Leucobacter allii TaxID=2932247 RepID=A0ABY4FK99_9MICO|nr:hypothetical protein [Leucobacter allii]UOQ56757.1 hypothetical protein MUN78_13940 [Leucobacter allii]
MSKGRGGAARRALLWIGGALAGLVIAALLVVVTPAGQRALASATGRTATGDEPVLLGPDASASVLPPAGWRVEGPVAERLWLRSPDAGVAVEISAGSAEEDPEALVRETLGIDAFVNRETLGSGHTVTHGADGPRLVAVVASQPPLVFVVSAGDAGDDDRGIEVYRPAIAGILESVS